MYRSELLLDEKSYRVISCEYVISQKTDEHGRPTGIIKSGLIEVVIEGVDDETLAVWATDSEKQMDGNLTFYLADEDTIFKEVKFEGGFCVAYREFFLPLGNQVKGVQPSTSLIPYSIELAISAAKLSIDGHLHDNGWPA